MFLLYRGVGGLWAFELIARHHLSLEMVIKFRFHLFAEHHVMKDNPAFSMVNDSDEDVVFGSEDEGSKPLAINMTAKDDDSD